MDLIQHYRELAVAEITKNKLPDLIHFELSEQKAIELAHKLNADITIVKIGSYFMDLKLGEAFQQNKLPEHVVMSANAAKTILADSNLSPDDQAKILNCIEAHHGDVPYTCLEAEICANADCYRFIHPKGFFRFLNVLGARNSNFADCLQIAEKKLEEKNAIISLEICKQELEPYYTTLKSYLKLAK